MDRFIVEKEIEFDAGHRVPDHDSKCWNLHGHRYRVVVGVSGPLRSSGAETGMVIDFSRIKEALSKHVHDLYDHGMILYTDDPLGDLERVIGEDGYGMKLILVGWVPTAENMARSIFDDMSAILNVPEEIHFGPPTGRYDIKVEYVKVYETPTSVAIFAGESYESK
jgi:6-pyruvoyltetrahydropterin/6-carboxytetrahydropterin synthase